MSEKKREARLCQIRQYLSDHYMGGENFRFDVLSQKVQTLSGSPLKGEGEDRRGAQGWRDITDRDINSMAIACSEETGLSVTPRDIHTVLNSDFVPRIHPLRDWLDRCPEYTPNMPSWIDMLSGQVRPHPRPHPASPQGEGKEGEDMQKVWQVCFKKWFVGMVAGWMSDEVVNHQVLVLIGKQGIYKTTWLEHLMPPELRGYCCKMASSHELGKDDRIRVAEFGLISLDEIDAMSPRELNVLKSVITTTDVNERAAYGYTKERRIRCASFCASGNNKEFLTDDTGNRRWLPFEIESIENPWGRVEAWPLVYAEAKYLIEHGYNYWFDMDETESMECHKKAFTVTHNEEELLGAYFRPAGPEDAANAHFYSASEIHGRLKTWGNIERPMPLNKFGMLLKSKGFDRQKANGKYGYTVVEISTSTESVATARILLEGK